MVHYLIFQIYFYGEQGWDSWVKMVTNNLFFAVRTGNELLKDMRNDDHYKYDRDEFGICIMPVIDGEEIESPDNNNPSHTIDVDSNKLFSVGDFD